MDKRRSGIPGPSSGIGGIPKRAPSPSRAAFASAGGGPLGAYRPASRDGHHKDPSASSASRFGFPASSVGNDAATSSLPKTTPIATRVTAPPSTLSKRSISSTGINDSHLTTPNGGANKRPFLTSGSARTSLASSTPGNKDNSAIDAEYKRKELLSQQAYGRLQQELNAKGRELEKEKEERAGLLRQWESLNEEIRQERLQSAQQKRALQERVNELQSRNNDLTAHIDDADSERSKALQQAQSTKTNLSIRIAELEAQLSTKSSELEGQDQARQRAEAELKTQEEDWQKERQRLQGNANGEEAGSAILTEELHKMLSKIRKLEADNLSLAHENKQLQSRKDSVEALKEQNRNLENKVGVMAELRRRVAESESQLHDLEAEKQGWQSSVKTGKDTSAYQEAYARCSDTDAKVIEIEEPEEISLQTIGPYLARLQGAYAGLLVRSEALVQRSNHLRKECQELEELKNAEAEQAEKLRLALDESKMATMKSEKARETIAMEVESYKRLLETYQTEAQNLSAQYDGASAEQISLLQSQLDARTAELSELTAELQTAQKDLSILKAPGNISADEKDRLEREHEEREKELLKQIQESKQTYDDLEKQCVSLGKANDDLFARLGRGEFDQSKLRVLEMTDNPVSRDRVIRTSMLEGLKKENAQLIEQIRDLNERIGQHQSASDHQPSSIPSDGGVVPAQSLENMREEYSKLQQQMHDRDKAFDRLKEAFGAKATEYVAAVKALFGYDMHVISKGKVKLRSVYARTSKGTSLTFDAGEQDDVANMRLVGEARQGAANVANLKRYWLNADRCSVPCFLAALQLELYESTTQAARQGWAEGEDEE